MRHVRHTFPLALVLCSITALHCSSQQADVVSPPTSVPNSDPPVEPIKPSAPDLDQGATDAAQGESLRIPSQAGLASRSAGCGIEQVPPRGADVNTSGNAAYAAYQPAQYAPNGVGGKGYPVMLALHGCFASYKAFAQMDFHTYVGNDGIVIYPSSANPNESGSCSWDPYGTADVERLMSIVSDVAAKYCVDLSKIYVLGFSWGAYMAHALACSKPGAIKAVAAAAGGYDENARNAGVGVCGRVPTLIYGRTFDQDERIEKSDLARTKRILGVNGCSAASQPAAFPFSANRPNPPSQFSNVKGCVEHLGCVDGLRNTFCEDPFDLTTIGGSASWNHALWQPYIRPVWEWFGSLP